MTVHEAPLGEVDRPVPSRLVIVRHASTEWSKSGRHTGRTDVPLDDDGRKMAAGLGPYLAPFACGLVRSSPLRRALSTCALAGFGDDPITDDGLLEWEYGAYEGWTTAEIRSDRPGWDLFRDGCPDGEDAVAVGARVDDFLARLAATGWPVAVAFAHGHVLRVLIARWLGLPPERGSSFLLAPGGIGVLSHERERTVLESLTL